MSTVWPSHLYVYCRAVTTSPGERLIVLHKEAREGVEHPVSAVGSVHAQWDWVHFSGELHDLTQVRMGIIDTLMMCHFLPSTSTCGHVKRDYARTLARRDTLMMCHFLPSPRTGGHVKRDYARTLARRDTLMMGHFLPSPRTGGHLQRDYARTLARRDTLMMGHFLLSPRTGGHVKRDYARTFARRSLSIEKCILVDSFTLNITLASLL